MRKLILLALLLPVSAFACSLAWDFPAENEGWLTGFAFYQDGALVGELLDPSARSTDCVAVNVVPSASALTMTAFARDESRGYEQSSPQSEPAQLTLPPPGVRVIVLLQ